MYKTHWRTYQPGQTSESDDVTARGASATAKQHKRLYPAAILSATTEVLYQKLFASKRARANYTVFKVE